MIHRVKIINYIGNELVMDLKNPEKSGFLIYNMTGIGPEKAEIRITDIVTADGGIYNSSRLPVRNIVIGIRFFANDTKTVEDIRQESYKYFPIKKPLTLTIETDNRICEIVGYVESNEPVIFSKEVHTQLSIICPYPYFFDGGLNANNVTIFAGVEFLFEFPFENESLTEKLLIMGNLKNKGEEVIVYSGDSEIGFTIIIDAIGEVFNLSIFNLITGENMFIDSYKLSDLTGSTMIAGDRIIISTVQGKKGITLLRDGIYTNIINVLGRGTDWFQLRKGDNIFGFSASWGIENLLFRIENRTIFEGV